MKRLHILLLLILMICSAWAQNWPMWRANSSNSGYNKTGPSLPFQLKSTITPPAQIEENGLLVIEGVLYATTSDGQLHAYEVETGMTLPGFPVQVAGGRNLSSPVYGDNKIFVRHGADGKIYAINAASGERELEPMSAGSTQNPRFCGPVIAEGKIYAGGGDGYLYAYDISTGQPVSGFPVAVGGDDYGSSPAIAGGNVYFNSSEGKVYAFNAGNGEPITGFPVTLVATALRKNRTGHVPWETTIGVNASSLTVVDGKIYVFAGDDKLYAINATNGQMISGFPVTTGGSSLGYFGSPAVANEVVYIFCHDGQLYAYDAITGATMDGFPVSLNPDGFLNFSSPSVNDSLVFIGAGETKTWYAIGAANTLHAGKIRWRYQLTSKDDRGFSLCSPVLANGLLFLTINNGDIYVFENNASWTGGSVLINNGDAKTTTLEVHLALNPGTNSLAAVDSMIISDSPHFTGAAWEPFTETKGWILANQTGKHTLYAQFKDVNEKYSQIFNDDIRYGQPVGPVSSLIATALATDQIVLQWTNPNNADWKGTRILRKTAGYSTSANDGVVVYDGRNATVTDNGLEPNTAYYYVAFAYDIANAFTEPGETSKATAATWKPAPKPVWKLTITSTDISAFPVVKSFVTAVDSINKIAVSGLTATNYTVKEDDQNESPITVTALNSSAGAKADIVFVLDITSGMVGELEGLKNRITTFIETLAARGIDYRLSLVTFDDNVRNISVFTNDAATFKGWLNGFTAAGGDDAKENALEGLAEATSLDFRPVCQRIAILITDAPYHQAGDVGGNGTTTYTTTSMIDRLLEYNLITYVIGPDMADHHRLADEAGGVWFNIANDNFQTTLDSASAILANQYVVTYTTHNQLRNSTWRNVLIHAANETVSAEDRNKYYISGVTTMTAAFGPPSAADTWVKYTVPLSAKNFGVSQSDFTTILSAVKLFRIRMETSDASDVAGLDSVKIGNRFFSSFDSGLDNWSASGDGTASWQSSGGKLNGYLQISDWASGDWYYATAPSTWTGDWQSLIGQEIVFYFKNNHPDYAAQVEIISTSEKRLILALTPTRFKGGSNAQIAISLSEASSSDVLVLLNSSNTAGCISMPSPIIVAHNQTSATASFVVPEVTSRCSTTITASAEGYASTRLTVEVDPRIDEDKAILTGRVTDATTGSGISGAVIMVSGINAATDANGYYRVENISADVLAADFSASPRSGKSPLSVKFTDYSNIGYQPVVVTAAGYYRYESHVTFKKSETKNLDFSLSPEISAGEMRMVLNWGAAPLDLDLHLYTPLVEGSHHEVYWNNIGSKNSAPFVYLDHDDTDGFGPETITISKSLSGVYYCFVENYSTSPSITASSGVVQIYSAAGLVQTIPAPVSGDGLYWYVCDINGSTGAITVRNVLQNHSPSGSLHKRISKPYATSALESMQNVTEITSWAWDLNNDGVTDDTRQHPDHVFSKPGNYSVTLKVSDGSSNASITKERYISVLPSVDTEVAWFKQTSSITTKLNCVFGLDTLHAWAAGENGVILKTLNGGASWQSINTFSTFNIKDIYFINENTGWAVGADGKGNSVIIKTNNNGATWTRWYGSATNGLHANHMTDALAGWNVGEAGKIEKTADGGANWLAQSSGVTSVLRSVHFSSAETGWVVGDNGVILKTSNAGYNWVSQNSGASHSLTGVFFVSDQVGWISTSSGQILATENGGAAWNSKTLGETNLQDICFVDEFLGYTVGNGGAIHKTYDGGDNWAADNSGVSVNLNALHVVTSTCGWAVGDGGTILRLRRGLVVCGPVTKVTATARSASTIALTWTNPTDANYNGTIIVRKTGSYPAHSEDGARVYSGTAGTFLDSGLKPETTYYYTAFAHTAAGVFSDPVEDSYGRATTLEGLELYGWKVNISSIDAGSFPSIKSFVTIVDSATSTPVTGLTADHFKVREDGTLESPITVETISSGSGAKADIVFVFDATGSMGGEISGLKERASAFADALASRGIDYRLALISFGDEIRSTNDFTSDLATFKGWINGLYASGGGDIKENSLEGLAKAVTLSFRPISQRIAILITDAPYHQAGETGGGGATTYTTESIIKLLDDHKVATSVVGPDESQFHQIAEGTGGLWFDISANFQTIIDRISAILSSQYVVTYTTHNKDRDNTWRNVTIIAQKESKGGYDANKYFITGEMTNVYNFFATAISFDKIYCRWSNPGLKNYAGIRVMRKTSGYPTSAEDGVQVYNGTGSAFIDSSLTPETPYYYHAFTYTATGATAALSENARGSAKTWPAWTISGNWVKKNSGVSNDLYSVSAVDTSNAWVVGKAGAHLYTNNGGTTWEAKFVNTNYTLHSIDMISKQTGWAAGQNGDNSLNLKTNSSGASWTAWPCSTTSPLYGISMISGLVGWQVGAKGFIEKTSNGGATWTAQYTNADITFYGVNFIDEQTGWVVGSAGVILKTIDSGATWTTQTSGVTSTITDVCFLDNLNGWAVTADGKVLRTMDGGSNWSSKSVATVSLNGISFSDVLSGWVVGNSGTIYRTQDSGATWQLVESGVTTNLNAVNTPSSLKGWAVGDGGVILQWTSNTSSPTGLSGYLVNCTSVDAESFPVVKCFVTVVDAIGRSAVAGLTKDNFRVKENGVVESPLTVTSMSSTSGAKADIVFVFDVTGSMGDEITGLKQRAYAFADSLQAKGVQYRLALITFGDAVDQVRDFTTDIAEFKTWIEGLRASGGGDTKENALEGLAAAAKLSWRATSQKIGILITDAPYHQAGETGGGGTTTYTTESIIALFQEGGGICHVVGPDLTAHHQLAEKTGGFWFNITANFTGIIDAIAGLLAKQYVITYTTHDPIPDADWRNLLIFAEKGDKGGYDSGRYIVGSSRLTLSPQVVIGKAGMNFSVDVNAEALRNLGLVHLVVSYEPGKIRFINHTVGSYLAQGGASAPLFTVTRDSATGKVDITATRVAADGANGSGVLCSLNFYVKIDACAGEIAFSSVDLRTPDNAAISVTYTKTQIQAAKTTGLVGDLDNDTDIDLKDFILLSNCWQPKNDAKGDIGPASGSTPALTPIKDGVVNFEDLFVFTRMWNWYRSSIPASGSGSLGKVNPVLQWQVTNAATEGTGFTTELQTLDVRRLAMGHLVVRYDPNCLSVAAIRAGNLMSATAVTSAFMSEHNSNQGVVDICFSRLSDNGEAEINENGSLLQIEWQRLNAAASPVISLAQVDLRSADNSGLVVGYVQETTLAGAGLPTQFELLQNFPNPFNNRTEVVFRTPVDGRVRIDVLNILGQPVRVLREGACTAGSHRLAWDGKNEMGQEVVSGVYILRMEAPGFSSNRIMAFIK